MRPTGPLRLAAGLLAGALGLAGHGPAAASGTDQTPVGDVRNAVFVGNNWEGTVDVLAPGSLKRLGRINMIPDQEQRMAEIAANPERLAYYLAIREAIGEGNDQLVDDMFTSNDGRLLIASRPSYADVVAISLETGEVVWRFPVAGQRSDHMAISPDGAKVVVSASTANLVHVLRVRDGEELGSFPSGGSPHENTFIDGGRKIIHASIGYVYTPTDQDRMDPAKGERVLQVVDADTYEVLRRYDLRKALDERGLEGKSTAVRPMTLGPDESYVYFQVSFFHGFLEMDLATGEIGRVKKLPNLVPDTPREQYLLDSAHHGIAMNKRGNKICVAGTMSDYATVVDRRSLEHGPLLKEPDGKPYWVTRSRTGRHCYISWSGTDKIAKISYRTGRIVDERAVGDHPQRIRNGFVARDLVAGLPAPGDLPEYEPMPPTLS
ncbi:YncE family protein [Nocardioides sp. GCM10027113]|uniref:YncE family protein n=1 Tax=unclassified Nocardioides TaxID=2615069 RepID=UPI003623199A